MPSATVTLPDGRRARLTADSPEELEAAVSSLVSEAEKPAVVSAGETIRGIPRQIGLAGRYLAEGVGALPAAIANVPASIYNAGADAIQGEGQGFRFPDQNQAISGALTAAGVPSPETPTERVVGDMSRLVAGAGATAGIAPAMTAAGMQAPALAQSLAANPAAQATSAMGAGFAGGSVREAGGGPVEQFLASLAGGLAAPAAMGAAQRAGSAVAARMTGPDRVRTEQQLRIILQSGPAEQRVDWKSLPAQLRSQMVDDAQQFVSRGEKLNPDAVRRLAAFRGIGATPLRGDITQDPNILTQQRNLAKVQASVPGLSGTNLADIQNQNAKTVLSTLDDLATSSDDAITAGRRIIGRVEGVDQRARGIENKLYASARDAAGQEIPLDRGDFVKRAFDELVKQGKFHALPASIKNYLDDIQAGVVKVNGQDIPVPFTVNTIDELKTMLATASRGTADGNVKRSLAIVRNALENTQAAPVMPVTGATATPAQAAAINQAKQIPADALALLNKARKFASSRRTWQESAKFIEAALDGADPDTFVRKQIINAPTKNVADIRKLVGSSDTIKESVRTQLIAYIKQRGGADSDVTRFSSKGLEDAVKSLGDEKLRLWFTPQEINRIKFAVSVGKYMQAQPIGAAVNNSNTAGALVGRVVSMLDSVISKVPVIGPMTEGPLRNATVALQSRQMQNVNPVLGLPKPPQKMPVPAAGLAALAVVPPEDDR